MPDGAAGQGTPISGQFSRWGPAQWPAGPRAVHCRPPSRGTGMGPAALRTVSAIPMYGSRRTLGFPPRRNHLGTGGPSRRPPSAGCADRRSAQFSRWGLPCLRVAPPGGMGAMRQFSVRVAPSATRRALPSLRNAGWLDPNRAKRALFRAFAALATAYRSSDPAIQPRNARTCSSNVSSVSGSRSSRARMRSASIRYP